MKLTFFSFRKPTFTGLLSKFSAFSPLLVKKNLIATLTYRAYHISSTFFNFHKEIEFLKDILQKNEYPLVFIEKQIKKTLEKCYGATDCRLTKDDDNVPTEVKPVLFLTHFLGSHSELLSKNLRDLMREHLPNIKLQIMFKSDCVIGNLFGFKDKLPESCMTKFIYKYTCECCNAFYIGKSYRQFKVRVYEHIGKSYYTEKWLNTPVSSKIREHCDSKGHAMNPSQFVIIDRSRYQNDLLLLESLHQKIKKPTIGTQLESTPLLCFD